MKKEFEYALEKYAKERGVSSERIVGICNEFIDGFSFIKNIKKAVSIFGSTRCSTDSDAYQQATKLAFDLSHEGFAIVTGGGPGIMEGANRGAFEAGGKSVGLNIILSKKQQSNKYVKESIFFQHFYSRKTMLSFASQVYIYFPGGFGTLDELFEMLILVQTKEIPPTPIILVGKEFWSPLTEWIEKIIYEKHRAVSKEDLKIFYLVDDAKEAYDLVVKITKNKI